MFNQESLSRKHIHATKNTPLPSTCSACYPCLRPICAPGTTTRAGYSPPSLLRRVHRDALHGPPCLPPFVTQATEITASAHEARATDAAAFDVTALRNRSVGAAATGHTLLMLSIPPAVRLDQSEYRQWRIDRQGGVRKQGNKNSRVKKKIKKSQGYTLTNYTVVVLCG